MARIKITLDLSESTAAALIMNHDAAKIGGNPRGYDQSLKVYVQELVEIKAAEDFEIIHGEKLDPWFKRYRGKIFGRVLKRLVA